MDNSYLESYADRCVLVTGGAGAIGSHLCAALLRHGAGKVVILDDLSSAERWNIPEDPRLLFVHGSVLCEEDLRRIFSERPLIVYHLAALFANQNSVDHPERDLMVNGLGTLKVLQYAHLGAVERVVYASSGCSVYGKSPLPLREDFLSMDLNTPYQITKMLGELYCNFYGNFYGLQVVRTRFFNSYGPGEIPGRYRNVIPNFIYWALRGEPLPITGTGEETRDWTFVADIVDGLLCAGSMKEAVGEAYNLASGKETRVIDVARWINEATENTAGVRYVERRKWDTKDRLLASVDKAKSALGYEPRTDFRQGLRQTVEWFRANWDQIQASARF
ncbi:MAG: NAD-dependent epimerase/dehydratase family protein [Nitrospinota bacterium]